MQIPLARKDADNELFLFRQFGEEIALNTCLFGMLFRFHPSHGSYKVLGILNKGGLVVTYQLIAANGRGIRDASRNGKAVAVVAFGQLGGDEGATFDSGLYYDGGIAHTCHDAVAADKVMPVGIGFGEELGKQTAGCQHIDGCFTMNIGIDAVQSVGKDGNGGEIVCQCRTMGMDVDAVSQAAHYKYIGTKGGQIVQKVGTELFAVVRSTASAYHVDDMKAVEVGVAFKEKNSRSILTLTQAGRVSLVLQSQTGEAVFLYEFHLPLGTQEGSGAIECRHYRRTYPGKKFGKLFPLMEYLGGTPYTVN